MRLPVSPRLCPRPLTGLARAQVGVELVERTGRSPHYVYQSLGCSKASVNRMVRYAKTQCVGKPFSNTGMARSLLWPRQTDGSSFFCAELVAAILKEGGLLEASSNPGSATPETLHKIYLSRAAVTANPYVLRDLNATTGLTFCNTMGAAASQCHQRSSGASAGTTIGGITAQERAAERETLLQHRSIMAPVPPPHRLVTTASTIGELRRGDSPPRGHFRVITHVGSGRAGAGTGRAGTGRDATAGAAASMYALRGGGSSGQTARAVRAAEAAASANTGTSGSRTGMQLTLNSLDMRSPNL